MGHAPEPKPAVEFTWPVGHGPKIRGQTQYSLSPWRLRAFAGTFTDGPQKVFRRTAQTAPWIVAVGIPFYMLMQWAHAQAHANHRK